MAYIPYGKLDISLLAEGDIVYYKGEAKFPNSRQSHYEDLLLLVESIGLFKAENEGQHVDGIFVHGQVMSGTLMGAYIDNITQEEIAKTD